MDASLGWLLLFTYSYFCHVLIKPASLNPWLFYLLFLGPSRAPWVARKARKERPEGEFLSSHLLMGPIFSLFSITFPSTSEVRLMYYSPMPPYCWHVDYTHLHYRPMTKHSVTFLDYGKFSQALVCFGSCFDQAVRLHCQVPFVKLEGKQS